MRLAGAWILALIVIPSAFAGEADRGRVDSLALERDARALASRIDARLAARWASQSIQPSARADDGEFLRRASLDLVGRIPTAAEARDFLDDPNPAKRSALVDRLLDSPAYAARAVTLWRQLLLPDSGDQALQVDPSGFEAWLTKRVAEDAGYDRIVREILGVKLVGRDGNAMATGGFEPTPAAFYSAKGGKPESLAADSARAFLGIRLECAQCHNHPFAKWKREEFWGFAAFFAGVPRQVDDDGNARMVRDDPNRKELTIPGTSTVVKATNLDHSTPAWRPRADTREVLAEWITAPNNPYFARAAVNRTWARLLGYGLIDPVDDLDASGDPGMVELLGVIADDFRDHGYNLKYLIRALMATRAYHLSSASAPGSSTSGSTVTFERMPVRGLSPAQFLDSLSQATGNDLGDARARFLELFADRDELPTESQTSILQALTLMNGSYLEKSTNPETGEILGAIAGAPYLDTAGRVEQIYLAALTRRPKPEESSRVVAYIDRHPEADRPKALGDAFWALLNGPEFRINH
jgi:hypothetical protein